MKFCPECGEKLKKGVKKCPKCSKKKQKLKQGFVIAGLVIGIVSIVLSFVFSILILPLAILGLIFTICGTGKKGKKVAGIVTNALAIFISIVMVFVWAAIIFASTTKNNGFLDELFGSNKVEGKWYCSISNSYNNTNNYLLTLDLKDNKKFDRRLYKNPTKTYAYGTYSYTKEKEIMPNGKEYYEVTLHPTTLYLYGRNMRTKTSTTYKMYITHKTYPRKATLINKTSYNSYYCEEK